ncbi:MAG TPA: hypothetical protein VF235_01555 [Actinomycetota bacterium]
MRRTRSPLVAVLLGLSLVLGSVALAGVFAAGPDTSDATTQRTFWISGKVRGLYPGRVKTVKVTVRNPSARRLRVTRLAATVSSTTAACPRRAVRVKPWRGELRVPPHSARRVRLAVRMRPTAPDGCQGIRFRLRYHGKGIVLR